MCNKYTIDKIKGFKKKKHPFAVVTAYEYVSAKVADEGGFPILLVGDSAAMVMLGYDSTLPISIDELLIFVKAVSRGSKKALIVADMPFLSYQSSVSDTIKNAGLLVKFGGANAVKLEGGQSIIKNVSALVACGIPVMGHLGLTPQSINQLSGYKVQGKTLNKARLMISDALALERAGAFSIVLECVPQELALLITKKLSIPTIGIGAGPFCDGQVQVYHDILGLNSSFFPAHSIQYNNLYSQISENLTSFKKDVENSVFPKKEKNSVFTPEQLQVLMDDFS